MKSLIHFEEFGPGMGFPSMKDSFCKEPYPGKDKIIAHLKNGRKTYAAVGCARDVFSHERISGEYCGMTDGEFSWNSALTHYVEKYNLRLSPEFERKVLGSDTKN